MRISIDISLYPLTKGYVEPILHFIEQLERHPDIIVKRNSLSTQVFGDYHQVMSMMSTEIEAVFEQLPESVFVLKIVGSDRADIVDK